MGFKIISRTQTINKLFFLLPLLLLFFSPQFSCIYENDVSSNNRRLMDMEWMDSASLVTEPRAPLLMKFTSDQTKSGNNNNVSQGVCGICTIVYRVLFRTGDSPANDCKPYHNSRQSNFGDISNFYHILSKSGKLNDTLEFPLADEFPKFSFRFSIMYLASRRSEPGLLIETGSQTKHVLCVQSVKCPDPVLPTPKQTLVPISNPQQNLDTTAAAAATSTLYTTVSTSATNEPGPLNPVSQTRSDAKSERSSSEFWDTLLSGTEPKNWFLATVSLACISLLLIILLIGTWIYVCRIKKLYNRRRCRGACRFGCRCPPELVRQTVVDAAVCGPLGMPNQQQFTSPMSPQGNGSLRSGSGFGNTIYGGGTLTSNRWGSNGHKLGSPLYVAMGGNVANAMPDKTPLIPAGCNTPNCMLDGVGILPSNQSVDESWSQRNGHFRARVRSKKSSQDALHRSTSDGSTVSEITENRISNTQNTLLNDSKLKNPNSLLFQYRTGQTVSFTDDLSSGMVMSNNSVNYHGKQLTDKLNSVYLPSDITAFNRECAVSPVNGRKSTDQYYYLNTSTNRINTDNSSNNNNTTNNNNISSTSSSNQMNVENSNLDQQIRHVEMSYLPYNKHTPNLQIDQCREINNYDTAQHHIIPHTTHDSVGDGLDITPPSGFYDFNTANSSSTMTTNSTTAITTTSLANSRETATPNESDNNIYNLDMNRCMLNSYNPTSQTTSRGMAVMMNQGGYTGRQSFLTPLYPILGSPTSQSNLSIKYTKPSLINNSNNKMKETTDNVGVSSKLTNSSSNGSEMVGCLDDYYSTKCGNSEDLINGIDKLSNYLNSNSIRPIINRPTLCGTNNM